MRLLRVVPVLGLLLATLALSGCATLTGLVTKALFVPADQSGPQVELTGSMDNGFPEYMLPAGRPGTVHLEFPGPYANGTGLGKTCTVEWSKVGTSEVPITTIDQAVVLEYVLPGGLTLGQSPVTITCRVAEGTSAGQDYVARLIMTARYDYVYWTTKKGIARAKISADEALINHSFIADLKGATSVTTYNDKIYFSSDAGIGRADLDGTNVDKEWLKTPGGSVLTDLMVHSSRGDDVLAWITEGTVKSRRLPDGTVGSGVSGGAVALAGNSGRQYLILSKPDGTSRMMTDVGNQYGLGKGTVGGLTIADGHPYWTSDGSVQTLGPNGEVRTVATPARQLGEITFDGSRLLTVTASDEAKPLIIRVDRSGEAKDFPAIDPTGGIAAGPGRDPAPRITVEDAAGNPVSELSFDYPPDASPTMGQTARFYLRNSGNAPLAPIGMNLADASAFGVYRAPQTVAPGQRAEIGISFYPPRGGDYRSVLRISGNINPTGSVEIRLRGRWNATPPKLSVTPNSLSFDKTTVGATSHTQWIMISSGSPFAASFPSDSVTLDGADKENFEVTANDCRAITVPRGDHCDISVRFTPKSPGDKMAALVITALEGSPQSVTLTGTAVQLGPVFAVSPTQHHFGRTATGFPTDWKTFTVSNTGSEDLKMPAGAISVTGTHANEFDFTPDTCDDVVLAPGRTCTVKVLFSPFTVGAKSAQLQIEATDPASPHLIALAGTAVAPALSYAPNPVPDLDTTAGLPVSGTVTITNDSDADVAIPAGGVQITGDTLLSIDTDGCSDKTLSKAQQCDVKYTFSPTATDAPGMYFADIEISHDGAGNPLDIPVSGVLQP